MQALNRLELTFIANKFICWKILKNDIKKALEGLNNSNLEELEALNNEHHVRSILALILTLKVLGEDTP